jgi:aerobic-type carbon monoxide dehydrogenase small subunit (CoxS/CutS family)
MDDEPVSSCGVYVEDIAGTKIVTIEGLEKDGKLHPVQQAFVENDALQCGFCTPGMVLNAIGLLKRNPEPTRQDIIEGMEDNLCRCGAHTRIIDAILSASKMMKGVPMP